AQDACHQTRSEGKQQICHCSVVVDIKPPLDNLRHAQVQQCGANTDHAKPDHWLQWSQCRHTEILKQMRRPEPILGPLQPVVWFGMISVGSTLLNLGVTEV